MIAIRGEWGGNMLPLERRQNIMNELSLNKSVRVIDLSKRFNVTEETIRRDLEKLEKEGNLKRTYGGAVLVRASNGGLPFNSRFYENIESKLKIGKLVQSLIKDGDVLMMDSSTTSFEVVKQLNGNKKVTIITNSMAIMWELVENKEIEAICVGGHLIPEALAFTGTISERVIKRYYADKVIVSCEGMDMKRGIMESNELEASVKRTMIKAAEEVILLVDNEKFNCFSMAKLVDFSAINIVVTDTQPPDDWLEFFSDKNIKCIYEEQNR